MIDIHCHLLPGIDDGPRDWDQSLALCQAMVDDGITRAVVTPHLIDGVYENTRPLVERLTAELSERLGAAGIALEVLAGAEVDISSRLIGEDSDDLPLLGGGAAVLLEMPVAVIPHAMGDIIFQATSRDLVPVLAHPERNAILQQNPALAREWIDAGAAMQLDGDSLLGIWGRRTKLCSETLLLEGLFHAMASDAHSCDARPPQLRAALKKATALVGEEAVKLVTSGPEMILQGKHPGTPLYRVERGEVPEQPSLLGRLLGRDRR